MYYVPLQIPTLKSNFKDIYTTKPFSTFCRKLKLGKRNVVGFHEIQDTMGAKMEKEKRTAQYLLLLQPQNGAHCLSIELINAK